MATLPNVDNVVTSPPPLKRKPPIDWAEGAPTDSRTSTLFPSARVPAGTFHPSPSSPSPNLYAAQPHSIYNNYNWYHPRRYFYQYNPFAHSYPPFAQSSYGSRNHFAASNRAGIEHNTTFPPPPNQTPPRLYQGAAPSTPTPAVTELTPETVTEEEEEDHQDPDLTPRRLILDSPTSDYFKKKNNYYSHLKEKRGKELEEAMMDVLYDETKDKSNGNKERKIDVYLMFAVFKALLHFLYKPSRRRMKSVGEAFVEVVMMLLESFFPQETRQLMIDKVKHVLRTEHMNPWKYQFAIDISPVGSFNYGALANLRKNVEGLLKGAYGLIPSPSAVKKCAYHLEAYAHLLGLGFVEVETDVGIAYKFDFDNLLRMMVEKYDMVEVAKTGSKKRPMLIAVSLDFAMLTDKLGHLTGGLKDVDPRIKDPVTREKILCWQSRDNCTVFFMLFGKDTKQAHHEGVVKEFLDYFKGKVVVPAVGDKPELSNFQVINPVDMHAHFITTGLGGGTKVYFCLSCICKNKQKADYKTGDNMCDDCLTHPDITRCYCHKVVDGAHLVEIKEVLTTYWDETHDDDFKQFDDMKEESTILDDPEQVNKEREPKHIDFVPQGRTETVKFNKLLNDELLLRHRCDRLSDEDFEYYTSLGYAGKRDEMKKILEYENEFISMRAKWDRNKFATWFTADQAIPCILHLICRVVERMFYGLLNICLERYLPGDNAKRKAFMVAVSEYISTVVLGDSRTGYKNEWTFETVETTKDSGMYKCVQKGMTGTRCRHFMKHISGIAEVCFDSQFDQSGCSDSHRAEIREENEEYLRLWKELMVVWLSIVSWLDYEENFKEREILELHWLTATFMHLWCIIFKNGNIGNYVHMIGAGHLTYYLRKYKNLSRFQQQGWEALNQMMKRFFFSNSNHGGSEGSFKDELERGKHCKALVRLCMRRNMWFFGLAHEYFLGQAVVAAPSLGEELGEELRDAELDTVNQLDPLSLRDPPAPGPLVGPRLANGEPIPAGFDPSRTF